MFNVNLLFCDYILLYSMGIHKSIATECTKDQNT